MPISQSTFLGPHPEDLRATPDHLEKVFSAGVIQDAVIRLATEITPWAEEARRTTGEQILALCVLRGGVFFFSDLLKRIPVSIEPGFVRCRSYRSDSNGVKVGEASIALHDVNVAGRSVLLVDDICDSGGTFARLSQHLTTLGARTVEAVSLIHRIRSDSQFQPRWAAFRHDGPEWFAGYGMEDENHWMNRPDVYFIRK